MAVEAQLGTEKPGPVSGGNHTLICQLCQGATRLVSLIELQYRIRPHLSGRQARLDKLTQAVVQDVDEALEISPILINYMIP
ncbi:MAG: hypothetical protein PHW74_14795 [Desulfobacca sp.]|nr:hypothetical protein [Desulfobacca sp.]